MEKEYREKREKRWWEQRTEGEECRRARKVLVELERGKKTGDERLSEVVKGDEGRCDDDEVIKREMKGLLKRWR